MRRYRKTKIIATLGPASSEKKVIQALFLEGADVFRLNFSHGSELDHAKRVEAIREIETEFARPIGILADLQGPKIRVGKFESDSVTLVKGQTFRLDLQESLGDETRIPLPHPEVIEALSEGDPILIDDGRLRLEVIHKGKDFLETKVIVGGIISDHKGVNIPDTPLPITPLTAKDREDLSFALDQGVDFVGLSFVQHPDDVREARKLIKGRAQIISKIEKPGAIKHMDEIIELSDGILVARGDLGVELPPEDVPPIQKELIRHCRQAGKPVIVATQMLESMIKNPIPTRAEASDVATAVYEGADAVMLSAESAKGAYPVEAVQMMERIRNRVERDPHYRDLLEASRHDPEATEADAISAAARQVVHTLKGTAIVAYSNSGYTTTRMARERPEAAILGLTPKERVARQQTLTWGVHSYQTKDLEDVGSMGELAAEIALQQELAKNGDRVVVTAGTPFYKPGTTNILKIVTVGKSEK